VILKSISIASFEAVCEIELYNLIGLPESQWKW